MKSSIGKNIHISLFGESHSEAMGVVIDGLAPGIKLDLDFIQTKLNLRKAQGKISTQRHENDEFKIVSGFFNGYTTGTPLCILIENTAQHSKDYEKTKDLMRPSHADYSAEMKYEGFQDYRGGGHFSGRLTAPIVAAGAICTQVLASKGIKIGTHISQLSDLKDSQFSDEPKVLDQQIEALSIHYFPTLDRNAEKQMIEKIESMQAQGDSVGGVLESVITHMPAGIGEPFFHSIESTLSSLIYSIPAIKGIEFGSGFDFVNMQGSQSNDPFYFDEGVKTKTNHNGGINGGVSNGMPIILRTVVKPTSSIYKTQDTINVKTHENTQIKIEGRHDPAIIHRARVVVDSMIAIGLLDLFCERYGYLWMTHDQ